MGDAIGVWTTAAGVLREKVSDAVWRSTFADVVPSDAPEGALVLSVPNSWAKKRIEARYLDDLDQPAREVPETTPEADPTPGTGPFQQNLGLSNGSGRANGSRLETLNPKYTFDHFVIGSSNRFAHAAALAVAERPALTYNPLFIYGDAGLGKTHLLQAVAHFVRETYPNFLIRYVTSETFLNDYIESIRNRTHDAFRRKYRTTPDVLLVDDIQFVENKEGFQEELFHTFNDLYETSRQIVLTSDRSPDHIATLEDRLRSRFKWGLITDIQPPDLETRLAILRQKAAREAAEIPHEVLEFIAESITDNIRELEGALTKVVAFAMLTKEPLTAENVRGVLADLLSEHQPRPITPQLVLDTTARMFSLTVEDITGKARTRDLVDARHIAMYVCRQLTNPPLSFPQIAKAFGGRDHTTVMNAVQRIEKDMKQRQKTFDRVNELTHLVRNGE